MTYYPDACAAAKDVMRECVRAVAGMDGESAAEASWQRERFFVLTAVLA
jgi:hypothetical protein